MKAPAMKEKEITTQIRNVLKLYGVFHWKVFQSLGATPGVPDILGILPGGRMLAIEVKTERGKLSPHQERFIKNINDNGGLAFVARSFDDVVRTLRMECRTNT
jgi:Holliday junction resolvase